MADILHRVGINVPVQKVYEALTTVDGIASWWTRDAEGGADLGGKLVLYFGKPEPSAVMEVIEVDTNRLVSWQCIDGPAEWVGTRVDFVLKESDNETVLVFTHSNWKEPVEFMHHCSTKWAQFLIGLKLLLEGGESASHPADVPVSSWS
jgi:uncharacterized protein YndB with AHSA1/START domain